MASTKRLRSQSARLVQQSKQRDAVIRRLLVDLALVLLPIGVTPNYLNFLARHAFVQAAATHSRFRNGKINYSRVAVLTGLTRAEVKRALTGAAHEPSAGTMFQSRADRVLHGWLVDPSFQDKQGTPRQLPIHGKGSFVRLAKKYGGDVPHSAILEELLRAGAVKRIHDQVAINRKWAAQRSTASIALAQVAAVIADAARIASRAEAENIQTPIYRLQLEARDKVELLVLRRRVSQAIKSLFDGLRGSLQYRARSTKRRRGETLSLTTIVAEHDDLVKDGNGRVRARQGLKQ